MWGDIAYTTVIASRMATKAFNIGDNPKIVSLLYLPYQGNSSTVTSQSRVGTLPFDELKEV
jgi:hypothetical protein